MNMKYALMITDCYDMYLADYSLPGIYNLDSIEDSVYCLPQGWTTIQHRGQYDNPIDMFAKLWTEYVNGFGTPGKVVL